MYISYNNSNNVSITFSKGTILFSYETAVCFYDRKKNVIYRTNQFYSATTTKHINYWLKYHNLLEIEQILLDDLKFKSLLLKI